MWPNSSLPDLGTDREGGDEITQDGEADGLAFFGVKLHAGGATAGGAGGEGFAVGRARGDDRGIGGFGEK